MKTNISQFTKSTAAALALTAAASSAFAQSSYTGQFNDNTINCETLQGRLDPTPGGFTCGFVQEVDRYKAGAKLKCAGGEGDSFSAMQPAASHMADFHGEPDRFQHLRTQIALKLNNDDARAAVSFLEENHPGQGREFYFTYAAMEGLAHRLRQGKGYNTAASEVVQIFNQRDWDVPGPGNNEEALWTFLKDNPAMEARLVCLQEYPDLPWSTYQR